MGSAVLTPSTRPLPPAPPEPLAAPVSAEVLRQEAAARITAHRDRRQQLTSRTIAITPEAAGQPATASPHRAADPRGNKSRIASAVAERYAQAQSYRAFLAAEAERAVQQARAAAEIAARNAQAVAEARQQLLDSLAAEAAAQAAARIRAESGAQAVAQAAAESEAAQLEAAPAPWPDLAPEQDHVAPAAGRHSDPETHHFRSTLSSGQTPAPAPTVRVAFYEEIPPLPTVPVISRPSAAYFPDPSDPEAYLLDEEISFRQAPVFEEPAGPPTALPANLIEFPRQLVASRKVRPRYAEGPLREDGAPADNGSQLRIFEVDPTQIATAPDAIAAAEARWTALWLDTPTFAPAPPLLASDSQAASSEAAAFLTGDAAHDLPAATVAPQLYPARWSRRTLAASIDLGITFAATLGFAAAFAAITGHVATGAWDTQSLLAGAADSLHGVPLLTGLGVFAGTGMALSLAYQALFFTFADATPGMRLARVGLCTLSDDNPTRSAMRRRIPALVLSTLLFGIGFLWALLDEDGLPWHDLISRMYPRSY